MDTRGLIGLGAAGGMLAGLVMALALMLVGWIDDLRTAWDAPMAITAWLFGLEHFGLPGNHAGAILAGLGLHMANAAMLGVVLVLAAGIAASFLTADLFNLFVAFEVMLIASYVLLTRGAAREQILSLIHI